MSGVGLPAEAAPPAENGLIIWSRTFFFHDAEIWSYDPATGRNAQVVENEQNDFNPAWSQDGQFVAFESSSATDVDIWIARRHSGASRNLTQNPDAADRWPSFSPNGSRIVFARQTFDGASSIWAIDFDGTDLAQLTDGSGADIQPVWSPDGSTIVFASDRDGNYELYTMNADGSEEQRLTSTPFNHEGNPDWAPDGTRIAYDACRGPSYPCVGNAEYDIFVVDRDGTDRVRITDDERIDANPAWSPDGTKIAFRSDRLIFTAIWVMNADGSDPVAITPFELKGGVDPDWQPVL